MRGIPIPIKFDFRGFARSVRQVSKRMDTFHRRMTGQARALNHALTMGFVFVGTHQLAGVNRKFREFEHTLLSVRAKIGGMTDNEFTRLSDKIKEVAAASTKTATEVAEAAEKFALLGFGARDIENALQSTIDASVATGTAIDDIAYTAGSVSRAVSRTFEDINDLLVATATNSGTNIEDMAVGLKYAQASFRGLGLSAEEAFVLIGKLANVGVRGSVMGTAFRSGLAALARDLNNLSDASTWSDLEKQLSRQQETLRKHNIMIRKDSKGNILNFREMLDILIEHKASTADFINILGTRSGTYFAALANTTKASNKKLEEAIENYVGTALRVRMEMEKSLKSQWSLALARWEDLQLAISESGLGDAEMTFVKGLQGSLTALKENLSTVLPIALKVGAALGGLGLALALRLLGSAAWFALRPIAMVPVALLRIAFSLRRLLLLTAGGAAFAGIVMFWDTIRKGIDMVRPAIDYVWEKLKRLGSWFNERFLKDTQKLDDLTERLEEAMKNERAFAKELIAHQTMLNNRRAAGMGITQEMLKKEADLIRSRKEWADQVGKLLIDTSKEKDEVAASKSKLELMLENAGDLLAENTRSASEFWDELSGKGKIEGARQHLDEFVNQAANGLRLAYGNLAQEVADDEFDKVIDRDRGLYGKFRFGFAGGHDPFASDKNTDVTEDGKSMWGREHVSRITNAASQISEGASKVAASFGKVAEGSENMVSAVLTGFEAMAQADAKLGKDTAKNAKKVALMQVKLNTAKAIMAIWGMNYGAETMPTWGKIALTGFVTSLGKKQHDLVKKTDFGGQAHGGLTSVPATGTYLLERGEMVATRNQNAMLQDFLMRERQGDAQPMYLQIESNRADGGFVANLSSRELRELNDRLMQANQGGKHSVSQARPI